MHLFIFFSWFIG